MNNPLTNGDTPIKIAFQDIDKNGSMDGFIGIQYNGSKKTVPFDFRNELIMQVPTLKKQFPDYKSFANISFNDLINLRSDKSLSTITIDETKHHLLINHDDKLSLVPLPIAAQMSPMYGMTSTNFNDDQFIDILGTNNLKDTREFWGTYSAMNGVYLTNTNNNKLFAFTSLAQKIKGDSRSIISSFYNGELIYWISRIDEPFLKLTNSCESCFFYAAKKDEEYALITYKDGSVRKEEFYIGQGFRSDSQTGVMIFNIEDVESLQIKNKAGFIDIEYKIDDTLYN